MGVVDTLASLKAWDQAECLLALPRDLGTIAMTETVKGYLRRQNDAELAKRRAADIVRVPSSLTGPARRSHDWRGERKRERLPVTSPPWSGAA